MRAACRSAETGLPGSIGIAAGFRVQSAPFAHG